MTLPAQPFFATPAQRLAWARQRFFERGEAPSGLLGEALIQSWQRCVRAGREGSERVALEPVSALRLDSALRRSRQLCEAAAESFQRLELALGGSGCRLLLADAEGMIVRLSQAPASAARDEGVLPQLARLGVNVSESLLGTNAPGVVLRTGQACSVSGPEHFFEQVAAIHCAAAPIRDTQGRLAGVLDLSIEAPSGFGFDAQPLVGLYASAIENRLLRAQSEQHLVVELQASPELLGTPLAGLLGIAPDDGRLAWMNATAARLLGARDDDDGEGRHAEALLGLGLSALLAHSRHAELALLHLPNGLTVWARVQLQARDGLRGGVVAAAAPQPAAPVAAAPLAAEATSAPSLVDASRELIATTLQACGGNVSAAARRLGVSRGRVYRQLREGAR
ncbi:helix-turn-helix domain-containing protein [Paucibacter soli]|uniref:helix-turn-helix domain-containing protein n=1 Tax=Paucibacter soli TaxID=3133433 RepID=UPI00309AAD02